MKFIDEKGRLFGKVNLIDLAVVIVLLAAIGAVGMKAFGNRAVDAVTSKKVTLTYQVVCPDVGQDVAAYCQENIGGQLLSSGKLQDAYIVSCEVRDSETEEGTDTDLCFTIEAHTVESNATYAVGSQEIRVGKEHLVKTSNIEVAGNISNLEVNYD